MIASASSLVAAVLVSKFWGGGTLIGAAVTPVIVALVSEGLRKPAQVVTTVRGTRAGRYDPVAEGREGLRDGDLARARQPVPGDPEPRFHSVGAGERRTPRAPRAAAAPQAARPAVSPLRRRGALLAAVATGLIAFVVAGLLLTGSELVFGNSAVTSSDKRTTLLGGQSSQAKDEQKDTKTNTTTTETTTTPTTETTTTPTTETTTTPATTPQDGTVPAAPPAAQTAPSASPAPTPPPPAGTGPTTEQAPPATTP
jgi:hypothetical protein